MSSFHRIVVAPSMSNTVLYLIPLLLHCQFDLKKHPNITMYQRNFIYPTQTAVMENKTIRPLLLSFQRTSIFKYFVINRIKYGDHQLFLKYLIFYALYRHFALYIKSGNLQIFLYRQLIKNLLGIAKPQQTLRKLI